MERQDLLHQARSRGLDKARPSAAWSSGTA
jgi:hypothetical protein